MTGFDLDRFLAELAEWADEGGPPRAVAAYGRHPDQTAELRLPERGGPHPVAVLLHGGFWRARFTRASTAPIAVYLARRGFAAWNVEYRRLGSDGGFPATLADVADALEALADIPADLDRSRIVAIGHSAGGQLALWAAGTGKVTAAVSLAGVCDLAEAQRLGLGDGAVVEFLGGTLDERPEAYAEADPYRRLPVRIPQLLVHGDADDRVPVELSRRYADAARAAGDRCHLLELPGVDHFSLIDPRSEAWARAAAALEHLL